jgi:aminoglycoside N3'-acetyltransferase
MDPPAWPVAHIGRQLRALGLEQGALVMVHASLRRIGPVEGGAEGVIAAILEAVGSAGTMLMVLGAADDHAWVNERPEDERAELLADAKPFDALVTPAAPDVGTLAEVFRTYPGTLVSDHPEGRFAAHGRHATQLVADVPWDDYFGPRSPLERLVERDGMILRLGADRNTVTALHFAEYRCSVWPKRRVRRHRLVATPEGPVVRPVECLDDELGIVDYPAGDDYFEDLLVDYLATGGAKEGTIGAAQAELLEAADLVAFGARWMDERLEGEHQAVTMVGMLARIDADLADARKRRDDGAVRALRSLKAALANAEAVPAVLLPSTTVAGRADVARRELSAADIAAVVRAEIDERQRATAAYDAARVTTGSLEHELATLDPYRIPR